MKVFLPSSFWCVSLFLQVVWSPWAHLRLPEDVERAFELNLRRILFDSPERPSWYLGERVWCQVSRSGACLVPSPPPANMRHCCGLSDEALGLAIVGEPFDAFLSTTEDYATFRDSFLLGQLPTGVRI